MLYAEIPVLDVLPSPSVHAPLSRVGFRPGPVSARRPVRKESPPRPRSPRNPGKCPVESFLILRGFGGISPPDRLRSQARSSSGMRFVQNMCSTFLAPLALSRPRVPAHGVLEHGHPPPYKSPPLRPSRPRRVARAAPAVVACLSATPTLRPRDVNCPGGGTAAIGVGRLIPDVRFSVKSPPLMPCAARRRCAPIRLHCSCIREACAFSEHGAVCCPAL